MTKRDRATRETGKGGNTGAIRTAGSPLCCRTYRSGLPEDAVHLRAAMRALAFGHPAPGVASYDLALEVALLLALHAVAVVCLGHVASLPLSCPDRARGRDGPGHGTRTWFAVRRRARSRVRRRPHAPLTGGWRQVRIWWVARPIPTAPAYRAVGSPRGDIPGGPSAD